jgi:hypothetical protein
MSREEISVTITDPQPGRLSSLADAVEAGAISHGLRLLRRRLVRDVNGPWTAALDFRSQP